MWLIRSTTVYRNSTATVPSSQSGVLLVQLMGNSVNPTGIAVDSSGNVYVAEDLTIVFKSLTATVPSSQSGVLMVQLMDNSLVHGVLL